MNLNMPVESNSTFKQDLDKPNRKKQHRHRRHNSKTSLHHDAANDLFVIPDQFITSKFETVRGWDIIERGDWIVHGTSDNSPDAAKKDAIKKAAQIGANALIELEYYKTKGQKDTEGRGTYYYTIHNFRGRPVVLGKKSQQGQVTRQSLLALNSTHGNLYSNTGLYTKKNLSNLNQCASIINNKFISETSASKETSIKIWVIILFISFLYFLIASMFDLSFFWIIPLFIIAIIFGKTPNENSWLQPD